MEYKNELEDRAGGLATANLILGKESQCSVSTLSVKDHPLQSCLCFETLQLASCLG
jgi:hypothetical protein